MVLRNCDMKIFSARCAGKKIACYGIGSDFERILKNYGGYPWTERVSYLVDNDPARRGRAYRLGDRVCSILNLEDLLKEERSDLVIFITCSYYAQIVEQLNAVSELNQAECYIFSFMYALSEYGRLCIRRREEKRIPPTIHYCWFGKKELPDLYKRCIESWRRHCPEYRIVEWNEDTCDIGENLFAKQAYESGIYGFVPDYFRLKIIYEHGGVYLDTDVELIKNLDDLRYNEAFCGMQGPGEAALGLGFGAVKRHPVIGNLLKRYQTAQFQKADGTFEETASPVWQTTDLRRLGMRYGTAMQEVCGMTVYPMEVLSPKNLLTGEVHITNYTYAIHHYDGSWASGARREKNEKRKADAAAVRAMFVE